MESNKNLKKGTMVGLIVSIVLTAAVLISSVMGLIKDDQTGQAIKIAQLIANLITVALISFYAFAGYKKPHGNSLRNVFLIFAALIIARLILPHSHIENDILRYVAKSGFGLSAILIAFVGGRLHKIKQNRVLMIIIGALLLISSVIVVTSFPGFILMRCISNLAQPIIWTALCLAYLVRFEQHKAAGLEEK